MIIDLMATIVFCGSEGLLKDVDSVCDGIQFF